MAYEMVMPYHLHMPSYFLETFTEYPFLQLNTKKILLYVIGQDFLNYYFLQLEFSIARSTWERYHITNIGHTGNKQQQPFKTKSKTRMRT